MDDGTATDDGEVLLFSPPTADNTRGIVGRLRGLMSVAEVKVICFHLMKMM